MSNHAFCRKLLQEVLKDVRAQVRPAEIKKAWAYKSSFGGFEFHGPDGFYEMAKGDCLWSAHADGWEKYLTGLTRGSGEIA